MKIRLSELFLSVVCIVLLFLLFFARQSGSCNVIADLPDCICPSCPEIDCAEQVITDKVVQDWTNYQIVQAFTHNKQIETENQEEAKEMQK